MAKEIERKFLVNREKWKAIPKPEGDFFRQGYLSIEPEKTIRVRQTADQCFLTIKGKTSGISRLEFEYEIPKADAEILLNDFALSELSKIRYRISFAGKIWEVDEFLGENAGLILAEIELHNENESFELPEWIGVEVSHDQRYFNSNLTVEPYQKWHSNNN